MLLRSALVSAAFFSLFGCVSSGHKSVEQQVISNARDFADYDVNRIEKNRYSDAQQLGYLITFAKPYGPNNLDEYADGYFNWSRKTVQGLNAVGMSIGSISQLTGWTAIIGNMGNGQELSRVYAGNRLFIITPISGVDMCEKQNSSCTISHTLKQNSDTLKSIIEQAYQNDPYVKHTSSFEPVEQGLISERFSFMNKTMVAPFLDDANNLAYCTKPQHQALLESAEKEGEPLDFFPIGASCYASIDNYGNIFKNVESDNPYLSNGDILIQEASLPDYFPIEYLTTELENVFLYQPSVKYLIDDEKSDFNRLKELNPELAEQQLDIGRFSDVPMITQLSTRNSVNFGVKKTNE